MHIFPCDSNKKPLTSHGFRDATVDEAQIRSWWQRWPEASIGWVPGPSGHVVIDLDAPKNGGGDGREAFAQLAGPEPIGTSLVATTPNDGRHNVYRSPVGRRYGMANLKRLGIDVRGFDGYVILPDGRPGREWVEGGPLQTPAGEVPQWLVDWLDVTVGPARGQGEPRAYGKMSPAGAAQDERLEETRSALFAIDATVGRDEWLKCIFATHDALRGDERGADLVEEWSAQADPYDRRKRRGQYRKGEAYRIYASAASVAQRVFGKSARNVVTAATLFKFAAEQGWKSSPSRRELHVKFGAIGDEAPASEDLPSADHKTKASPDPDAIRLLEWGEVAELPMVLWQIRPLLPERSMVLLAGDTMMGKSFIAVDLSMRLVHNRPFFDRKVRPCSVLYLCGEGQQGLTARLRLWRELNGATVAEAEDRYCLISNRIPELNAKSAPNLRKLVAAIVDRKGHAPGLVIVDTLSQALDGDENESGVTAPVLRALASLRDEFGCTVLVIHHVVKRDQKQAFDRDGNERWFPLTLNQIRGSGAITRNMDTVLGVQGAKGNPSVFELIVLKQKDGENCEPIRFQRLPGQTGRKDEDGVPETSCVLVLAQVIPANTSEPSPDQILREREDDGIQRIVDVLRREGRLTSRDSVVRAAGLNLQQGRGFLDLALSRKVIVDVGRSKRPVFVLPEAAERVRQELNAERDSRPRKGGERLPPYPPGRRTDSPSASTSSNPSRTDRTDGTESEASSPTGQVEATPSPGEASRRAGGPRITRRTDPRRGNR